MEPTDEWWQAQLLKRLRRMRYQDEEATERLIIEPEERHGNDQQPKTESKPVAYFG